jgi:hypothetical protein
MLIWESQTFVWLFFLSYIYTKLEVMRIFYALILFLMLASCNSLKRVEYVEVPVEVVKERIVYNTKVDSVLVRDSSSMWIENDTVYLYKYQYKYKYINKVDTFRIVDSIPKIVTHEITNEVEVNRLYWWQKALMWGGGLLLLLILILIIYAILKIKHKIWN